MRHLLFAALLFLVWTVMGSAKPRPQAHKARGSYYYWYNYDGGYYVDYNDVGDEITELEDEYETLVNTVSAGGTPVEQGYNTDDYPHTSWPAVTLYAH